MKNGKLTIIRTAVGCSSTAGLINELKKRKIRVIGADCNPLSAGFNFCDKHYVIPKGNDPKFIKEILKICDREKPKAIISGPEEETLALAKNIKKFQKKNIMVVAPSLDVVKICGDKLLTYEFFKRNNIPTPKTSLNKNDLKFPLIIKPRHGRGSEQVYKIKNKAELEFFYKKADQPIFQEFVDGAEYTVDIFASPSGEILSVVPRARIKVESGISMKGKTVYDKEIINLSKKIADKLKLDGPACVQCIKTKTGVKFIEINARFGGGSILSMKADPTIIKNLIKLIKGEKPVKSRGFDQGLIMLRYYSEVYLK